MGSIKLESKDGDDVWISGDLDETDLAVTQGRVIVGNSSGDGVELDASGTTKILVGNGTTITSVALSGDITMSNAGVTAVGSGKVTNAMQKVPKLVVFQETFAFGAMTDSGATGTFVLTHTIPAGSDFVKCQIHALTGFTNDTSAVITIGDGSDVDRYQTGTPNVFVTATAGVDMGVPSGTKFHGTAVNTVTCVITTNADYTSVNAGAVTVSLWYYRPV